MWGAKGNNNKGEVGHENGTCEGGWVCENRYNEGKRERKKERITGRGNA